MRWGGSVEAELWEVILSLSKKNNQQVYLP